MKRTHQCFLDHSFVEVHTAFSRSATSPSWVCYPLHRICLEYPMPPLHISRSNFLEIICIYTLMNNEQCLCISFHQITVSHLLCISWVLFRFLNPILHHFCHILKSKDYLHLSTSIIIVLAYENRHRCRKNSIWGSHLNFGIQGSWTSALNTSLLKQ